MTLVDPNHGTKRRNAASPSITVIQLLRCCRLNQEPVSNGDLVLRGSMRRLRVGNGSTKNPGLAAVDHPIPSRGIDYGWVGEWFLFCLVVADSPFLRGSKQLASPISPCYPTGSEPAPSRTVVGLDLFQPGRSGGLVGHLFKPLLLSGM